MTAADRLRSLAAALPSNGSVMLTRDAIVEMLADENATGCVVSATDPLADLTVAGVADLFGKSTSTVRTWLSSDEFPNAYKFHGHEWRIPRLDVTALQRKHAGLHIEATKAQTPRTKAPADLGEWRKHAKKSA